MNRMVLFAADRNSGPSKLCAAAAGLADLGVERWWSGGETWTALLPPAAAPTAVARLHAAFVDGVNPP